jgi:argininosuccinate synthase
MKPKKIVLAYSGGLDTSILIPWLKEKYDASIVALAADVGQGGEVDPLKAKALASGADEAYVVDARRRFVEEYCWPLLRSGARYEGEYFLSASLSRPLISALLVETAAKSGADAVAHGSTGKGNDQVRFEVGVRSLKADLAVLAPVREWEFTSRDEEIEYAALKGVEVAATKAKPYSLDRNLWGVSIECGVLEDPWTAPPLDAYQMTDDPATGPDKPEEITISFDAGYPTAVDGRKLLPEELLKELNERAGKHGVGRFDLVENRLVGIKSREIYEAPGAMVLWTALRSLEALVWDREAQHFTRALSDKYAELVYNGLWFSPLREALDDYFTTLLRPATGDVRLTMHKGKVTATGRRSPYSLYDYKLATYEKEDAFIHRDGEGFCRIWGLPLQVRGKAQKGMVRRGTEGK